MRKIRQGDDVIVVAGKDKGKRGTVLSVVPGERVFVEGVNMVKKHQKPNPLQGTPGGIIEKEAPLHISNVMMFNKAKGGGDRIGVKTLEDGRKVRYFKSNNEVID